MLHIILLILKIIGIVLLCVLGILILTVVCLLFVPIRYRLIVTRKEGENQPPVEIWMKATWLLHFVNVLIRYPAELKARVRVMFFTIWRSAEGKDEDKHTSGKEKKKKQKQRKEREQRIRKRPYGKHLYKRIHFRGRKKAGRIWMNRHLFGTSFVLCPLS